MLTIDGAILVAEETAKKREEEANRLSEDDVYYKSIQQRELLREAEEQHQIASWLRELQQFRDESRHFVDDGR